jgi:hypothetical protein
MTVKQQFDRVHREFLDNEKFIINNPDLSIKSMLDAFEKQAKLEKLLGWLQNIENVINPSVILKPTDRNLQFVN